MSCNLCFCNRFHPDFFRITCPFPISIHTRIPEYLCSWFEDMSSIWNNFEEYKTLRSQSTKFYCNINDFMLKHHSKNDIFALDLVNCVDSCVAERQYKSKQLYSTLCTDACYWKKEASLVNNVCFEISQQFFFCKISFININFLKMKLKRIWVNRMMEVK